jgi:glycogen operon protein
MDDGAWNDGELRALGVYLGKSIHATDAEKLDDLFIVFNAGGDCEFTLPGVNGIDTWQRVIDTGAEKPFSTYKTDNKAMVYASSVAVFATETNAAMQPEKPERKNERHQWFRFFRRQGRR